jgi:signal peptidase I
MREEALRLKILNGEDMSPVLKIGEEINVKKVKAKEINVGDIIVFKRYVLIAHRVVCLLNFRERFFLTQGDKCVNVDSPVPYSVVLGKVVGKSIPIKQKKRCKILFATLLFNHIIFSQFLSNHVIRKMYRFHIRLVSFLLLS